MKVKVIKNVPTGQGFLFSTETLEGDKIGCIYSVTIKMADSTNIHGTTKDRRRQNYTKNNPKLSNLKFSVKVSQKRQVDSNFDKEFKAKEAAWKSRNRAQKTLIFGEDAFSVLDILDGVSIIVGG